MDNRVNKAPSGVTLRIIKRPSNGFWAILENRRVKSDYFENPTRIPDAVGLVQGQVATILAASDVAEKSAAVQVAEIKGVCPTHMTLIALYGDTSAVEEALNAINNQLSDSIF